MFCKHRDYFGKVNEGVHKSKVLGLAINDVIPTILFSLIFAYLLKLDYLLTIICVFLLAILLHRMFCVNTTLNVLIFGEV
jgi:hypothetical protein